MLAFTMDMGSTRRAEKRAIRLDARKKYTYVMLQIPTGSGSSNMQYGSWQPCKINDIAQNITSRKRKENSIIVVTFYAESV